MICADTLEELETKFPPDLVDTLKDKGLIEWPDCDEFYSDYFGGSFYLIETDEDLTHIKNTKFKSILEEADAFDQCEFINEQYVLILLCVNNAGGPTYFVHKKFVDKYLTIKDSISLTAKVWA